MYGKTGEKNPMLERISESHPMYGITGENYPMFGKNYSIISKTKISLANLG
jgi:hemoglobin-like flavoprotein